MDRPPALPANLRVDVLPILGSHVNVLRVRFTVIAAATLMWSLVDRSGVSAQQPAAPATRAGPSSACPDT